MVVVLIWDGLRPDFVQSDITPNLCNWVQDGVTFNDHHAVFPTETRVNASSIATGCYPGTHGIVANSIYVPEVTENAPLNTGDHEHLLQISAKQSLLDVPTLAKTLKKNGKRYAIASAGSPGSSWVQCAPLEGVMMNVRGVVHPKEVKKDAIARFGPFPAESLPASQRNDYVIDWMIEAIQNESYDVIFGWLCDPDFTQHKVGLGAPLALQSIAENDLRFKRLSCVCAGIDLFVGSDHGFSTLSGPIEHKNTFSEAGFDPTKIIWTGNGISLKESYKNQKEALVRYILEQDWVAGVFTRGKKGAIEGEIEGTFSTGSIGLDHRRTPDIVFSRRWSDAPNEYGIPGTVYGANGIASHGSGSRFDLQNILLASGPNLAKGKVVDVPSGNVDLAPTIQHLLLGQVRPDVDGRVLYEALAQETEPGHVEKLIHELSWGGQTRYLQKSKVCQTEYVDSVWVT